MIMKRYRKVCYQGLIQQGYENPVLFFDRMGTRYSSYWGSGDKRMEVIYNPLDSTVAIYELEYLKK